MQLYFREFGSKQRGTPVVLLHGLFGSSANWQGIARRLESEHRVLVPDLRNHGRSEHRPEMTFPAMAADLTALLDRLGIATTHLVGHSMGGKVAMWLALRQPERVARLVVVDIAPVSYPHRFDGILDALVHVPLAKLNQRRDVDSELARDIGSRQVRAYLLQNLDRDSVGQWRWRMNLSALRRHLGDLTGFPTAPANAQFPGPALFIAGGSSDYVGPDRLPEIHRWFPYARLRVIPGAGHWVYADQPEAFVATLRAFLPGASEE